MLWGVRLQQPGDVEGVADEVGLGDEMDGEQPWLAEEDRTDMEVAGGLTGTDMYEDGGLSGEEADIDEAEG